MDWSSQQSQPAVIEPVPQGVRPLISVGAIGRTAHEKIGPRARREKVRLDAETRAAPRMRKSGRNIVRIDVYNQEPDRMRCDQYSRSVVIRMIRSGQD